MGEEQPQRPEPQKLMLTPIDEDLVIKQWTIGEILQPKWKRRKEEIANPGLKEKLDTIQPEKLKTPTMIGDAFTPDEWQEMLLIFHADPDRKAVQRILKMQCIWTMRQAPVEKLQDLYMVQWPLAQQLALSGKLIDFARNIRHGIIPQDGQAVVENIKTIYENFDLDIMVGAPVLLRPHGKVSMCAVDGISRICAAFWKIDDGAFDPKVQTLPIIVGESPNVLLWEAIPRQMETAV